MLVCLVLCLQSQMEWPSSLCAVKPHSDPQQSGHCPALFPGSLRYGVEPNPASLIPPTCLNDQESPGEVLKLPENAKPWVQVSEAKDVFGLIYKMGRKPIFVNIF